MSLPGGGANNSRFRALAVVFVPEAAELSEADWLEAEAIVALALAGRPAVVRRQIGLFLHLLDGASLVMHRRSLRALAIDDRARLLHSLETSRLLLIRRGVWGLRTLAFMGYYARPAGAERIGYRASAAGWADRTNMVPR
jgi:hypothetical protein